MLGRAILAQLAGRKDVDVLALDRTLAPDIAKNVTRKIVDLRNDRAVETELANFRPATFIHAAATGMQHPLPSDAELRQVNIDMPAELFRCTARTRDCHFVHVSSALAYAEQRRPLREEDPIGNTHPYGNTKAEAERSLREMARELECRLTIIRPFTFTGVGDSGSRLFPSLLQAALEKKPFEMSAGEQIRDHCAVNDVARGVIAAVMDRAAMESVYNLGSGDTRSLREIVRSVADELELGADIVVGARPYSPYEIMYSVADISKARSRLGWKPEQNLAHAVWELARDSFPALQVREPVARL